MNRTIHIALAVLAILAAAAGAPPALAQERPDPSRVALKPGDKLLLRVWLDSSYVDTVSVDEQSRVILPRVGLVPLAGVPAMAIPDSVRSAFHVYLKVRSIEVVPLRRIGILGEVRKPGVYYVDLTTKLRDAISLAGGVGDIGNPKTITVIRQGVSERVADWQSEGSTFSPLMSGDEIVVERVSFVERNALAVVTGVSVLASILFTLFRK